MLLGNEEKSAREKVLEKLLGSLDDMDSEKLSSKKPVAAEISVMSAKPSSLDSAMAGADHDEVEELEEKHFPEEEGEEEKMEGGISDEQKMMIEELYKKYCC